MQQLSDEEKLQIQNLAREFTTQTLGDLCPKNKCFSICYPLHLYLNSKGFEDKNLIETGLYDGTHHFWLILKDEKTIIDPTIRQFNKQAPYVYFGEKTEHREMINYSFQGVYEMWMGELLDPKGTKMDTEVLLKINGIVKNLGCAMYSVDLMTLCELKTVNKICVSFCMNFKY